MMVILEILRKNRFKYDFTHYIAVPSFLGRVLE
jgi:hypothetical protein